MISESPQSADEEGRGQHVAVSMDLAEPDAVMALAGPGRDRLRVDGFPAPRRGMISDRRKASSAQRGARPLPARRDSANTSRHRPSRSARDPNPGDRGSCHS
jgi:hypothetical protein